MTTDAYHPLTQRDREFLMPPTPRQRAARLDRVRKHSMLVSWLRYTLPVVAVATLGLYFISSEIHITVGDMEASVAGVVIEKGNLRMVNPRLEGANEKQGAYVVTAKYAEQAVTNPDIIHLTQLSAEMNNAQKGWSRMSSPKGTFETKSERLQLAGDIRVAQSNGMVAQLSQAMVEMKTQLVTSAEPVKVDFPSGKLDARKMRINMGTREAEFVGDVNIVLQPQAEKKQTKTPDTTAQPGLAGVLRNDVPVTILAPRLTIHDTEKLAHFEGGVTTAQDSSQMTSADLKVFYAADEPANTAKPPAGRKGAQLKWIDATGDVRIAAKDGRNASADKLTYDALKQKLTLDNHVVLSQAGNVLKGRKMISDMASGITRFPPLGRVSGHFEPTGQGAQQKVASAPSAEAKIGQMDFSSTQGKPIDIEADSLVVNDKKRVAVFHGKVKAVQGELIIQSSKLDVKYSAGKEGADRSKITSIRADGKVLINTADDQATTSDWAVFDATKDTVTIGGNVVLSQGENVVKGDELVIDLKTNRSRFVNRGDPSTRQRIRGLFIPKKSTAQ